jgi:hypothetical protein
MPVAQPTEETADVRELTTCARCGATTSTDDRFCRSCGTTLAPASRPPLPPPPPMPPPPPPGYVSPTGHAAWQQGIVVEPRHGPPTGGGTAVFVLPLISAALLLVSAVVGLAAAAAADQGRIGDAVRRSESSDQWYAFAVTVGLAIFVVCVVWSYRATRWATTRARRTRFGTGMAIGMWFIPVANVLLVFLHLRDLHAAAGDGRRGGAWTTAWFVTVLVGYAVFTAPRVGETTTSLAEAVSRARVSALGEIVLAAAGACLGTAVFRISRRMRAADLS